jgi:phycobilisome linker polypeptide/uncharacterized protein DUF4214/EF hand domain-containing protein
MYRAAMLLLALTFSPAVVLAQQPCTTDARQVVNELYRHMLERGADAGSAGWAQQLESGRATVRDIVRQIAKSDEHTQRFWKQEAGEDTPYSRATGILYRHILGRQPDPEGARSWAAQGARSGVGGIVDQITGSPEYNNQFGDWGVPGSGGLRFCGNNQTVSQAPVAPVVRGNQRRFQNMDRNGDGVISRAEWRGNAQTFEDEDWNNDGILSGDELNAAATRPRGRAVGTSGAAARFGSLDVNGNGRVELREWDGTAAAFDRLDTNNDNVLSRAEMEQ